MSGAGAKTAPNHTLPQSAGFRQHKAVNWSTTCAAVIPCCNEEAAIAGLVEQVRAHLPLVIVVDDGSMDQTAARASQAGAIVIRQPANLGKGAALKAGV